MITPEQQSIVKATILLRKVNDKEKCVPDWAIHNCVITFGLTDKVVRGIRDIIQEYKL